MAEFVSVHISIAQAAPLFFVPPLVGVALRREALDGPAPGRLQL